MTTKAELKKKIARLESVNDHLKTELQYLDELMRMIGFSQGLATVKATALEIHSQGYLEEGLNRVEEWEEDDDLHAI